VSPEPRKPDTHKQLELRPLLAELDQRLDADEPAIGCFKACLKQGAIQLENAFLAGSPVEPLVIGRARLVDEVLIRAWSHHTGQPGELSLVAVGGYGRGELHPASDIDVMVLAPESGADPWREQLEAFFTFLWDIGLEVGQSVRTVSQCEQEAAADITVATTLMESRLLTGSVEHLAEMQARTAPDRIWPSAEFFAAKRKEQLERHHRYHDTAYNLEPNVKGGPGGLRDIQMIGWVAKRHFAAETLDELVSQGFLNRKELRRLRAGQSFLWTVRFALHVFTGRREDRLLFDHQTQIAELLDYEDASNSLAVEQFMQRYYRTVKELSRLNEMLLQLFEEAILLDPDAPPTPLNARFQVRNGYLEIRYEDVFLESPSSLLEMFSLLQQRPELKGVSANTIRELREALGSVDEEFRQSPRNHRLFMDILRAPLGVTHELRRMNLYGVIGRYIPAFERVVGRMQYDLFHAYTVDEHTMFVVSNLRRFALRRFDHEYPACSQIMQEIPKPELAYLAGLFHDIGKGRGGDHSALGSVIAEAFCLEQGLSRYEARLVAWLVSHHLVLSTTAQKKDIADPDVIHEFALTVGDQVHLDFLYLLTVADVRGTNPKLWNSWKANLFEELYKRTKVVLRRGLENPIDREELIADHKQQALELLSVADSALGSIDHAPVWEGFNDDYFLTHSPEEIIWHTQLLAEHEHDQGKIRVAVRDVPQRGGMSVVVYAPSQFITFAPVTGALDELGLSIHDARLAPAGSGYTLSSYAVLERSESLEASESRLEEIRAGVKSAIERFDINAPQISRRVPRQVRMFSTQTRIEFSNDKAHARTVMELITGDRPGLASRVGRVMVALGIRLLNAKISTVGERAEDVFFLCDRKQRPLTLELREILKQRLLEELDDQPKQPARANPNLIN
jgi:[protein-PII] uridylyltransferase